jgi:branched-chain amino acid transport system ATP-binding protein
MARLPPSATTGFRSPTFRSGEWGPNVEQIASVLLELRNVDAVFDGIIQVLRSVNIEVQTGKVTALLGGNGAGKTTTLKAISGLLSVEHGKVTEGQIRFRGEDITNEDPVRVFRRGVVQVLEGRKVLAHLSVEQNLLVGGHHRSDRQSVREDIERVFTYFPRLRGLSNRISGYLSGGEMQMLLVGRALVAGPELLMLDEPSMGLAPTISGELFAAISAINRERGLTIMLVEQNAQAAMALCDYAYIIENGRIVLHGSREKLSQNEDVREFYLGLSLDSERRSFREVKHYKRRKRWLG